MTIVGHEGWYECAAGSGERETGSVQNTSSLFGPASLEVLREAAARGHELFFFDWVSSSRRRKFSFARRLPLTKKKS
jgi:hypothetical protein